MRRWNERHHKRAMIRGKSADDPGLHNAHGGVTENVVDTIHGLVGRMSRFSRTAAGMRELFVQVPKPRGGRQPCEIARRAGPASFSGRTIMKWWVSRFLSPGF